MYRQNQLRNYSLLLFHPAVELHFPKMAAAISFPLLPAGRPRGPLILTGNVHHDRQSQASKFRRKSPTLLKKETP